MDDPLLERLEVPGIVEALPDEPMTELVREAAGLAFEDEDDEEAGRVELGCEELDTLGTDDTCPPPPPVCPPPPACPPPPPCCANAAFGAITIAITSASAKITALVNRPCDEGEGTENEVFRVVDRGANLEAPEEALRQIALRSPIIRRSAAVYVM